MIILGLNFGHDAGATVIKDGKIEVCVIRERQTRVKHAMSLDIKTILKALDKANIAWQDIDFCAITSSQGMELIWDDPELLTISIGSHHSSIQVPCSMSQDIAPKLSQRTLQDLSSTGRIDRGVRYAKSLYLKFFPEYQKWVTEGKKIEYVGWIEEYVYDKLWLSQKNLQELRNNELSSYPLGSDFLKYGFHYPATISLNGVSRPAFFINHHMCHASSAYYQSGLCEAAIMTLDGGSGDGYDSGMFYFAEGNSIYPIAPHHSILGNLYDQVAYFLQLGGLSAGKLMGLAAYGKPVFYDPKFLGNWQDLMMLTGETEMYSVIDHWVYHCLSSAKEMNYDLTPLGDNKKMTAPINVDIAASTQKLFEENVLALVCILRGYLQRKNIKVDNLCLSGGTALNCPANSRIAKESGFSGVFIDPGCDDSGLAVGAALYCYHNLLNQPLIKKQGKTYSTPYLGPAISDDEIRTEILLFNEAIEFDQSESWADDAALELSNNKVIGWFYGRSEIGPRALGHRSILADPRDPKNWERVNEIKGREWWRPFAPVVLEAEVENWFYGAPIPSPYMLFNAFVKSEKVSAITHKDGSARIQTVNETNGPFYDLVKEFFKVTGIPILLNTSFNGPSDPIVESPRDALNFFVNSELDFLYIGPYKVRLRKGMAPKKSIDEKAKLWSNSAPVDAKEFLKDFEFRQLISDSIRKLVPSAPPINSIPQLIESHKGYNIVLFKGKYYAIHWNLGEVNLNCSDQIRSNGSDQNNLFYCDSLDCVKNKIDILELSQSSRFPFNYRMTTWLRVVSSAMRGILPQRFMNWLKRLR